MKFQDAVLSCELTMESGSVPLLIGESGIGKTALVKKISDILGAKLIVIDANLLKEGEIGGLPTIEDYDFIIEGKTTKRRRTVYALHHKLLEIDQILNKNPEEKIIFFLDEINRCEHAVQQELMNLILNREINGYILPDNVKVIAAMNPSNKYDSFMESDYQVVDMDPAQEDRFVWLELNSDCESWLKWGHDFNIHPHVLEFIASFPDFLHTPYAKESIKASPRSWERVSDSYKVYLEKQDKYPGNIFYNILRGNVGPTIAQEFYSFIENNKNPLIKPQEIFKESTLGSELITKVKLESHSRLYLTAKNTLLYLENKEDSKICVKIFAELLQYYPEDLKLAIMQEIKLIYPDTLYTEFLEEKSFVEGYFAVYEKMA